MKVIPYLASKFTSDHFKRIQIIFNDKDLDWNIKEDAVDQYKHAHPKEVSIVSENEYKVEVLESLFDSF